MKLQKLNTTNKNKNIKLLVSIFVLFLVTVVMFFVALKYDNTEHSFTDIFNALKNRDRANTEHQEIWTRFYKLLAMFLVISAFGVGGLLMQNVTRNALASPGVMGMTQAGKLGLSITSFYAVNVSIAGVYWIVLFSSAVPIIILFLMIKFSKNRFSGLSMAFIGIALGVIMSSIEWFIMYQNEQGSLFISSFLNDAFKGVSTQKLRVMGSIIGGSILLAFIFSKKFTLLEGGKDLSNSVGAKANRTRMIAIMMVVASVPAAMLLGGNVMFIGMMIPHIAKFMFRTKRYSILIPATIMVGSILMFGTALMTSQIYMHAHKSINMNAFVELMAAPAFMVLSRKAKI